MLLISGQGEFETGLLLNIMQSRPIKDVRAHCYCASLVCTLFIRVTSFSSARRVGNSTKYKAGDLYVNLVCEYFCWMLGDTNFFFGRALSFLIITIIIKNKKILYVRSFNYFSYNIQIGSNWYMDTGVRDLEVEILRLISLSDLMTYVPKIYHIGLYMLC